MRIYPLASFLVLLACQTKEKIGFVESIDPTISTILSAEATIEILAEGFLWSEGPVWIEAEKMILFSDIPSNTIYKWTQSKGLENYLSPSGNTQATEKNEGKGSNGLLINNKGQLVLCQHGDRRIALLNTGQDSGSVMFTTLADRYDGKRFNSPNDAVFNDDGDLFFTDPPYGLNDQDQDKTKEIPFNGVYKLKNTGEIRLLIDSLTRPNGIALLNDSTLLVANSDKNKARWYQYTLRGDKIQSGQLFFDATREAKTEKGLPDGLKISSKGIIYATGPGGVWIFNSTGTLLGKIRTRIATANCVLDKEEKYLYMTSSNYLLRVALQ